MKEGRYTRPSYLRGSGAYEGAKKGYKYVRGFIGLRTVAPLVERVAEGVASRLPVISKFGEEAAADSLRTLHGLDTKLAYLLSEADDWLDEKMADASTLEGKIIRAFTSSVAWAANFTPMVGDSVKKLMIEIDPDHLERSGTSAATSDESGPGESSVQAEDSTETNKKAEENESEKTATASNTSQAGEEEGGATAAASVNKRAEENGVNENEEGTVTPTEDEEPAPTKTGKKKKKKFLQNMGKGIKKVMNYPKTPTHDNPPATPSKEEREPSSSGSAGEVSPAASIDSTPVRTASTRRFFGTGQTPKSMVKQVMTSPQKA